MLSEVKKKDSFVYTANLFINQREREMISYPSDQHGAFSSLRVGNEHKLQVVLLSF